MFQLEEKQEGDNWILSAILSFIFAGLLVMFWPSLIAPFTFFEFWTTKGSLSEAIYGAWPMYAWGAGLTLFAIIFLGQRESGSKMDLLFSGFFKSVFAGVVEEMSFRWLLFFSAMIMLPVFDFIFLGFMGIHLVEWLYDFILCPIANFFTLGYLESYLENNISWVIGAAIISSNGRFRNGHAYLGPFGLVNSWFCGMYLHWVVFTYGLIPAIIIHFLYDFVVFSLAALSAQRGVYDFRFR